ncbi:MAG: transposase zinc-binding domain-containing protein [Enterovibrio sp.]
MQLSCKGRACSPCGTTATERWIAKQQYIALTLRVSNWIGVLI